MKWLIETFAVRRAWLRRCGWLGAVLWCAASVCAGSISKGPYIQVPAPGTVSVMWESLSNSPARVRFGPGDTLNQTNEVAEPKLFKSLAKTTDAGPTKTSPTRSFYLYEAVFNDLKPGTRYSYSVEIGDETTPPRQFRTLDAAADKVRFIAYGDTRSTPSIHSGLAAQFDRFNPDLILHTGDLVARGEDYDLWSREFFTPLAGVIDHVPFYSVIGNHEHDGTNYLNYFHLPGNELWYAVDVGPIHVLALDFRFRKTSDEQFEFARRDLLASKAPWKIVLFHEPVFNIGGHASAWGQTNYLPLFYEAKVDLVLAGHSHMYERFRPIARQVEGGGRSWAIAHVTTGGGGANLHTALKHPAIEVCETTNHFMVFDVDRDTLKARAIRADGSVLDQFEITKPGGHQRAEFLERVYPEENLKLFYEFSPGLAGRAVKLPAADGAAEVLLNIPPREPAAELEITLTPEAAASYELAGSPLHVTTPDGTATNNVWAKVSARTGVKVAENKSRELTPPLAFQATVKSGPAESLAYGAKVRVSKTAQDLFKESQPKDSAGAQ